MHALLCGYCKWKGMGGVSQEAYRPFKKKKQQLSDLNGLEDHGGINQLTPKLQISFRCQNWARQDNNCLFVLEFNLRKLLESREIRVGSGPGTFSVGEKKSRNNSDNNNKHHQIRRDFPSLPWCLFSECFINYCCGRHLAYWCFST